jgi:glycosyltransferase involved in cell wall biosynthesis
VVTPSFNQDEYLEGTIRSVLSQGYPNLEYFVIDGGSTDGSAGIINHYRELIDYSVSEPDRGQTHAIHRGFQRATGDILCWLNSDDLFEPCSLIRVAEIWRRYGGGIVITGGCREIKPPPPYHVHSPSVQQNFGRPVQLPLTSMLDLRRHWLTGDFFYQPEVFFPKAAFQLVGQLDESLNYAMDFDLWARLAMQKIPVVVLRHTLASFRFHDAQKTARRRDVLAETIQVANRYLTHSQSGISHRQATAIDRRNRLLINPWFESLNGLGRILKRLF